MRASWVRAALLLAIGATTAAADTLSYTGTFSEDDSVQLFSFTLDTAGTVTIQTFSFAGGVNGAGDTIPDGGFSPDLWLFDSDGNLLQLDTPESPDHAAPGDCGPRAIDPSTGFCWDAYINVVLSPGSYTVALTQDGNTSDGFLADGFSEQGDPNYTDLLSLGGYFYLPDGVTERSGAWAVDISGIPASTVPEPNSIDMIGLALAGGVYARQRWLQRRRVKA